MIGYLTDDGHGNITSVTTTTTGGLACGFNYDPWGASLTTGLGVPNTCTTANTPTDLQYGGERKDTSTGSYQLGTRTYDPSKAGFLEPDAYRNAPTAADLSVGTDPLTRDTYDYVNGDPVNLTDPDGHRPMCDNGECSSAILKSYAASSARAAAQAFREDAAAVTGASRVVARQLQSAWDSQLGPGNSGTYVLPALPRPWTFCAGTGTYVSQQGSFVTSPKGNCVNVPANMSVQVSASYDAPINDPTWEGTDKIRVTFKFARPDDVKNPHAQDPIDSAGRLDLAGLLSAEQDLNSDADATTDSFGNSHPTPPAERPGPCGGLNFSLKFLVSIGVGCGAISLGVGPAVGVNVGSAFYQNTAGTHDANYSCSAAFIYGGTAGIGMKPDARSTRR